MSEPDSGNTDTPTPPEPFLIGPPTNQAQVEILRRWRYEGYEPTTRHGHRPITDQDLVIPEEAPDV